MNTISQYKDYLERYIDDYFMPISDYNKVIYESMKYSFSVGGKRVRPTLMMMCYSLYKDNIEDIVPMAMAIEMIHTYSLIHDDLPCMDNDDLRRGKPTNHKIYGEAIATLAGDGLLNEAMNIMIEFSLKNGMKALKASKIISNCSGCEGMIGGQVVDICSEGHDISLEQLIYMHEKKTGALIKAAILSGAILGDADENELKMLEKFGEKLGLAFQIIDDILDVTSSTEALGKSQSDEKNNKSNFIKFYGLEKCKEISGNLTDECISILKSIGKNTEDLENLTLQLLNRNF